MARLPNAERAHVERGKITDYLLSLENPAGHSKAVFLFRFGFRADRWEDLAEALRSHCQQNEVTDVVETSFGVQYAILGALETPDGRNPEVLSVWQIDHGSDYPRLITAYPPG